MDRQTAGAGGRAAGEVPQGHHGSGEKAARRPSRTKPRRCAPQACTTQATRQTRHESKKKNCQRRAGREVSHRQTRLKPVLVGQFEFVEWTGDSYLLHSQFMGCERTRKRRSKAERLAMARL